MSIEKWLRQGLGRAATFIENNDPAQYREALLHACTHYLSYERTEQSRGPYLFDLIRLTGHPTTYRNGVLAALSSPTGEYGSDDVPQMFSLACSWVKDGDMEVKRTLYDVFARDAFERAEIECGQALVALEGLDALLFVLKFFDRMKPDDRRWQFDLLVTALEDRDGKEAARQALAADVAERPDLARLLELSREDEERWARARREQEARPRRSYGSIKRAIMGQESRTSFAGWGKDATDEELQSAARDLLSESDEKRLWDYLRIFMHRRFPGPNDRLVELTKHGTRRVAYAATNALIHLEDPNLRQLALELMSSPERSDLGVTLLAGRSRPGDYNRIEQLLCQSLSDDEHHHLGTAVHHFGGRE